MSIDDNIKKIAAKLSESLAAEKKVIAAIKAHEIKKNGSGEKKQGRFEAVKHTMRQRSLEKQLSGIKKEQEKLNFQLQKNLNRQPASKTPGIEKARTALEFITVTAGVAKIITTLATGHGKDMQELIPQHTIEDIATTPEVKSKRSNKIKGHEKENNGKDPKTTRQRKSGKEQHLEKKLSKDKLLIKEYDKEVRKHFYKSKDLRSSLEAADRSLLKKIGAKEGKDSKEEVRRAMQKQFGEESAKALDETRKKLEAERRRATEKEKQIKLDNGRTF